MVVAGAIEEIPVVLAVMDYRFMGGSMGSVVGESLPVPPKSRMTGSARWSSSRRPAGARMQEGILSLMQMAKISAALIAIN